MASASQSIEGTAANGVNGSKSYFQKTVCLQDWWLITAEKDFQGKRLAVAGLSSREQQAVRMFSSAPILKRYNVFTLETVDGICVLIKGIINKVRTEENGFPAEVCNQFFFGFPTYWEEYAEDCFGGELSNADVSKCTLGCDNLSTGVDVFSERIPSVNKNAINEEKHDISDKMDLSSEDHGNTFSSNLSIFTSLNSSTIAPREREKESIPTGQVVENTEILDRSKNLSGDAMKYLKPLLRSERNAIAQHDMDMNVNATTTNENGKRKSSSKNLKLCEKRIQSSRHCLMYKDGNCSPKLDAPKDLVEEELNGISAVKTVRCAERRHNVDDISLSEGRMSNHCLRKLKSKLKDQTTVNLLENVKNMSDSISIDNFDQLKNAAVIDEGETGNKSTSVLSGLGLQHATDGESVINLHANEQLCGNITGQVDKQKQNLNMALRSSIRLGDANQEDDLQMTVGKRERSAKKATKSGKTNRKLSYGSPVTKEETKKTSFASPESSSFKRSRSGRLLLPTLAFWRNQMAIYDLDRQIIGIQEGLYDVEPSRGRKSEHRRKRR